MVTLRIVFGLFLLLVFLIFFKKPDAHIDSEKADRALAKAKGISYEALLESRAKRRARTVPKATRALVFQRDDYRCKHCQATTHLTLDHILPFSQGGSHAPENLQVLCRKCNRKKGDKQTLLSNN